MPAKFPLIPMAACVALAGCVMPGSGDGDGPRRDVSPAALAALPEGMPPDFLLKNGDGCYMIVLEATEPLRGAPLRDDLGVPVCDA